MGFIFVGDEYNRRSDEVFVGFSNVVKVVEDVFIFDEDYDIYVERVKTII